MAVLTIKNITFGEGKPKICIPITGRTEPEILEAAGRIFALPHQVAEWRADYFEHATDPGRVRHILASLRERLPNSLLLFTFRTKREGGVRPLPTRHYLELCEAAAGSGFADLLDLELFTQAGIPKEAGVQEPADVPDMGLLSSVIAMAHAHGCHVILSSHDFQKTPPKEELFRRLSSMEAAGTDLAKLAVMPQKGEDVLALLSATQKASACLRCPVITMSMGKLGALSRVSGSLTGSCLTFGTAGEESAPGQLPAETLNRLLDIL